jgi:HK97 family phage prohead protease
MSRVHKTYEMSSFKALDDTPEDMGRFEAIVSVFGNVDVQGDRVVEGAFEKSIGSWRASGDPIPVIWSHQWGDPFAHIGYVEPGEMEEVKATPLLPGGLLVRGRIDVDRPFAKQVYDLMKQRRVREFSFAYDVVSERPGKDRANELTELNIIEVGPTLKGANPETVSLGVKSQLEKSAQIETSAAVIQAALELDPELAKALHTRKSEERTVTEELMEAEEKTGSKPWHIEEQDGKFCVIKDDDGEVEGCHDSREEAEAQMRALYAAEKAEGNSTVATSNSITITFDEETTKALQKAGRVIGAKRVSDLKTALGAAVETWAAEVNGALAEGDDDSEIGTASSEESDHKSELESLNSKLDELIEGE